MIHDESLKPTKQYVAAVNKANRTLVCISRCFEYKSVEYIKYLFTGLVRPHLEFGIQACIKDITLLEKTQRRATKKPPASVITGSSSTTPPR